MSKKRDRKSEPSSRPVDCYYCPKRADKVPFNNLDRHTERVHGSKILFPPWTKDFVPLSDFFSQSKRRKTSLPKPIPKTTDPKPVQNQTFMDPASMLSVEMADFAWILSKIGLIRFMQSDTERVVKTVRKVEHRFASYNEIKIEQNKRDRANQEVLLHENPVAFANHPLEEINQQWLKKHWPVLKKFSNKNVAVENYLKDYKSKALFFE